MWVVKISGSLNQDSLLPSWLELLVQLGGGRVTVVCGGGNFSAQSRQAHAHWRMDDSLLAHNMAVLAMTQAGYLALGIEPKLRMAVGEAGIRQVLRSGNTAVWLPIALLGAQPGVDQADAATSDCIALSLACRLNAERLVLVKSGEIRTMTSMSALSQAGIVHRSFESVSKRVGFAIDVLHSSDLAMMRFLLQGEIDPVLPVTAS
jgi:5-(aminomethyl)-3-furanmethanol phosphate kinase